MSTKLLIMISSQFVSTLSCWSGAPPVGRTRMLVNPNNEDLWNGWEAPEGAEKSWKDWVKAWKEQHKGLGNYLTDEEIKNGVKAAGHDVSDWPTDWKGLGPGYGGVSPPPWAYVPSDFGKPPKCYGSPLRGTCEEKIQRYGYNAYADECQEFEYSGCGGNANNFLTLERCEQECIGPPMGCDPQSSIPIMKFRPS